MKNILTYLLKFILFWLLVFLIQRLVFHFYNFSSSRQIETGTLLLGHLVALRFDFAVISYFIIIPLLLLVFNALKPIPRLESILKYYNFFLLFLVSLISVADLGLYSSWASRINTKALNYLGSSKETLVDILSAPVFVLLLILLVQYLVSHFLHRKIFRNLHFPKTYAGRVLLMLLLISPLIILGVRGGWAKKPVNKGWGYYSKFPLANNMAINSPWNLLYTFTHLHSEGGNPYMILPKAKADSLVKSFLKESGDTANSIIKIPRPNIVYIILESWTADVIEPLGGEKNVTPSFTELCKEGLLLTNYYATGNRTEQGLVALLSGFPAQPKTSIVREFGKFEKLPSFPQKLSDAGYQAEAIYGSNLNFANTGSYFNSLGFNRVFDAQAIPSTGRTLWGIYDENTFDFGVKEISSLSSPFFVTMLSITSHEPYDCPGPVYFKGGEPAKFMNSVHYTDKCLGDFFRKIKASPCFANTLFIITADHGHIYPRNLSDNQPERYHIPCLFIGGALKEEFKGKQDPAFCSQTDIPYTLLKQLGLKPDGFLWSRDLFNAKEKGFSLYTYDDGIGYLDKNHTLVYDYTSRKWIRAVPPDTSAGLFPKAYLQSFYDQYLHY